MYYDKMPHHEQNFYNRKQKLQIPPEVIILEEADSRSRVKSTQNSSRRGHSAHVRSGKITPSVPSPIKIKKKEKYPLSERYVQRVKANNPVSRQALDKKPNVMLVS